MIQARRDIDNEWEVIVTMETGQQFIVGHHMNNDAAYAMVDSLTFKGVAK